MSKKKITLIIIILIFVIFLTALFINTKKILYSTTYYFGFGSRRIKIYTNGDVYDYLEIENTNHKPDYKYLKTLTKNEMDNLTYKLKNNSNNQELDNYVKELVYGNTDFDNFGNY